MRNFKTDTFDPNLMDVLNISGSIWPNNFYTLVELAALYRASSTVDNNSTIVEIGICGGRSSSILFQTAKETSSKLILIDPWIYETPLCEPVFKRVAEFFNDVPYIHYRRRSEDIPHLIPNSIDFLHIDGDHQAKSVEQDCRMYLPKLKAGHLCAFHDYGDERYLGVSEEIERATKGWEDLGLFGRLKIKRKP